MMSRVVQSEFDLIRQFFTRPAKHTLVGVGDDAALISPSPGKVIAASSDMLVSGRHFFPETDPYRLGRKCLAVNLSDMAAMGAVPRWVLASIALPRLDAPWIEAFARGFAEEAERHQVDWVGGDTTSGPLNISVTILGEVDPQAALLRSGAQVGDDIYVSGSLGDANLGLQWLLKKISLPDTVVQKVVDRLECPTPRVALGLKIAGLAHAAIDISDGLIQDLGHILERSGVGARIEWSRVPLMPEFEAERGNRQIQEAALTGGDDYELCFTAAVTAAPEIALVAETLNLRLTKIGKIIAGQGLTILDGEARPMTFPHTGFDHFKASQNQ